MPMTDRPFNDLLTDALTEPMTSAQGSALDARVLTFVRTHRPPMRILQRPAVRRSLLLVALVMIVLPLAAVGNIGPFGFATPTEYEAELDAARAEVPLPAGRTWPDLTMAHEVQPPYPDGLPRDPVAVYGRGGGRSEIESVAMCIWFDEWLDARAAGDAEREQAATDQIQLFRTWPSWDSPFWDQSVRDHFNPIIDAVANGDPGPVEAEMPLNCAAVSDL